MTTKTRLAKKLAAYSLGIGGSTFIATCADADIIFTNFSGSATEGNNLDLDIDGDGNADFTISVNQIGPNGYATNTNFVGIYGATAGAGAAVGSDILPFAGLILGANNLGFGATISGQTNFYNGNGGFQAAYTAYNTGNSYGQFGTATPGGYVGIQFSDSTNTQRFGWIRIDITGSATGGAGGLGDVTVNVNGFAYAVDMSITAGQTAIPEPAAATALGLLALGAVGVRRRRKSAA